MILRDYHTHCGFSRCVKQKWTVAEGWKLAQARGIAKLGISNHVHFNSPIQDFFPQLKKEIDVLNTKNVLLGLELDIDSEDGRSVLKKETIDLVDYIIAGPHNQATGFLQMPDTTEEDVAAYFDSLGKMIMNSMKKIPITIYAHPFLQELNNFGNKYWVKYMKPLFYNIVGVCVDRGIAVELNGDMIESPENSESEDGSMNKKHISEKEIHDILLELYKIAVDNTQVKFSMGSDAHHPDKIGNLNLALYMVKKLNIPENRFIDIPKKAK